MASEEKRIERTLAFLVLAALATGCFLVLLPFLAPILWALILALVTWPAFQRVQSALKGRRTLAASAMILLLVGILLIPLIILAASLAEDAAGFVQRVRDFFS
ncbi:MAG: AI-2E family transporter, partial [Gammaproteobacteria bacterium]